MAGAPRAVTDPEAREVLTRLMQGQRQVLGPELIGSYLFGSMATGDFEPGISDLDTVVVVSSELTRDRLAALEELHRELAVAMPAWADRVEVVYVPSRALATFRTTVCPAARISPGEPFHAIEVDDEWLMDWYELRRVGVPLTGPPIASVVPAIAQEEYVEAVRRHLLAWPEEETPESLGDQAYAILTMCRGLHTWRTGALISKREAARWACEEMPQHARLIRDALAWRERSRNGRWIEGAATREVTKQFVLDVQDRLR
jgi:predicted nucleotidyltransferase